MFNSIKNGFLTISGCVCNHIWTSSFAYGTNYLLNIANSYIKDTSQYIEDYLWYYDYEEVGFVVDGLADIVSGLLDIKAANIVGTNPILKAGKGYIQDFFKPTANVVVPNNQPLIQEAAEAQNSFARGFNSTLSACKWVGQSLKEGLTWVGQSLKEGLSWVGDISGLNWALDQIGFSSDLSGPFLMIKLKGLMSIGTGLYKIGEEVISLFHDKPTYGSLTAKEIKKFIKEEEVTIMKMMNLNLEGGASEIALLKEACQTVMVDLTLLEEMMQNVQYHKIFTALSKVAPLFAASQPLQELKSHYSEIFSDESLEKSMIFTDTLSQILLYQPLINCFGYTKACENKISQLHLDKQVMYYLKNATQTKVIDSRGAFIEAELHQYLDNLGVVLPDADFKLLSSISLESEVLHNLFDMMNGLIV